MLNAGFCFFLYLSFPVNSLGGFHKIVYSIVIKYSFYVLLNTKLFCLYTVTIYYSIDILTKYLKKKSVQPLF